MCIYIYSLFVHGLLNVHTCIYLFDTYGFVSKTESAAWPRCPCGSRNGNQQIGNSNLFGFLLERSVHKIAHWGIPIRRSQMNIVAARLDVPASRLTSARISAMKGWVSHVFSTPCLKDKLFGEENSIRTLARYYHTFLSVQLQAWTRYSAHQRCKERTCVTISRELQHNHTADWPNERRNCDNIPPWK